MAIHGVTYMGPIGQKIVGINNPHELTSKGGTMYGCYVRLCGKLPKLVDYPHVQYEIHV